MSRAFENIENVGLEELKNKKLKEEYGDLLQQKD